jgi:hypothetical protein
LQKSSARAAVDLGSASATPGSGLHARRPGVFGRGRWRKGCGSGSNSDAEAHVRQRFPHKRTKRVGGLRPDSIASFLFGVPIFFQPGQAKGLDAVYHFTFAGAETAQATVTIRGGKIELVRELVGTPDCAVSADAATWVGFLRKERSIVWAILRRKVRVRGPLRLLQAFGRCFPM